MDRVIYILYSYYLYFVFIEIFSLAGADLLSWDLDVAESVKGFSQFTTRFSHSSCLLDETKSHFENKTECNLTKRKNTANGKKSRSDEDVDSKGWKGRLRFYIAKLVSTIIMYGDNSKHRNQERPGGKVCRRLEQGAFHFILFHFIFVDFTSVSRTALEALFRRHRRLFLFFFFLAEVQ